MSRTPWGGEGGVTVLSLNCWSRMYWNWCWSCARLRCVPSLNRGVRAGVRVRGDTRAHLESAAGHSCACGASVPEHV